MLSSLSPGFSPQRDTRGFSLVTKISTTLEGKLKTFTCSLKCRCGRWRHIPKWHEEIIGRDRHHHLTSLLLSSYSTLVFWSLPLVLEMKVEASTRKSVSSPKRTVFLSQADSTAVLTINMIGWAVVLL